MTVSSQTRKAGPYSCNGVTTGFSFNFKCFSTADVRVVLTDSLSVESDLVLDSDYTVALNSDQNSSPGGTVETVATYATGFKITLVGDVEFLQETDITNGGGFYPEVIENALDKVTMLVQQVKEEVDRAVKVDVSSSIVPEDYLSQASTVATNAAASASAADASATSALNSASAAAVSAGEIAGFEWASSWVTATAYLKNNLVSESGNTYIAISDHTSGTFSTDFGNGLWAIFASKGAAGAGTGDMLAANNLSEVNPGTARANLSAAKSGANSDITSLLGLTTPLVSDASETVSGKVELATSAEAIAGTDTVRAVTPASMKAGLNATGTAPIYACRAWGRFTGATGVLLAGGNCTVTRSSIGRYAVAFITNMPDANYSVVINGYDATGDAGSTGVVVAVSYGISGFTIDAEIGNASPSQADPTNVSFAVFR